MKIHEYQAKAILARYGVTTPRSEVAFTKEEARDGAQRLKSNVIVVKAQIHAGGRGKAGGVKLVHSPDEAAEVASRMDDDPIARIAAWLVAQGVDAAAIEADRRETTARINAAVAAAEAAPPPDMQTLLTDVQDAGAPEWR